MDINRLFEILRIHKEDQINIDKSEIDREWEKFARQLPQTNNADLNKGQQGSGHVSFLKGFISASVIAVTLGTVFYFATAKNSNKIINKEKDETTIPNKTQTNSPNEIAQKELKTQNENEDTESSQKIDNPSNVSIDNSYSASLKTSGNFLGKRSTQGVRRIEYNQKQRQIVTNSESYPSKNSIQNIDKNSIVHTDNLINKKSSESSNPEMISPKPNASSIPIQVTESSNLLIENSGSMVKDNGENIDRVINVSLLDFLPAKDILLASDKILKYPISTIMIQTESNIPRFFIGVEGKINNMKNGQQIGTRLLLGYNINRNLSIMAGGGIGSITGRHTKPPKGWPPLMNQKPLKEIETKVRLYELPVELRYNIIHNKFLDVYFGTQAARVLKQNEQGLYKFEKPGFPREDAIVKYANREVVQYGVSIGAKYQISNNIQLYASTQVVNQISRSKETNFLPGLNIGLNLNL